MRDPSTKSTGPTRSTPSFERAASRSPGAGAGRREEEEPSGPWLAVFAVLAGIAVAAWAVGNVLRDSPDPAVGHLGGVWVLIGAAVGLAACVAGAIGMAIAFRRSRTAHRPPGGTNRSAPPPHPGRPVARRRPSPARGRSNGPE
ncbi:hypothetical protein [Microbacterium sp. 5K110]|uniref:hypothetical protein n=1 Tax=unclassified Microbacterium TaxID=2609290 RepID=UPI0010FD1A2F|nr:hypothetical protein [Microbacterium sp. 5K110]TLF33611.1 hypothetical protein FE256_03095 [Microbacterium sp. 5K110]